MAVKSSPEDRYFLESLARGIRLLDHFAEASERGGLTLKEAADAGGVELTGALRIAHTLERLGYLTRGEDNKRYTLGPHAARLGLISIQGLDVRNVALPHIRALVDEVRETVSLARLFGSQAVVIERIETQHALTVRGRVGWAFAAHASSLGKALLAFLPSAERAAILRADPPQKVGPNTLTQLTHLEREFEQVRERGYALNDEESAAGIRAVAAPIRDATSAVVASINIGGPALRISRQNLVEALAPKVVEAAAAIGAEMGFRDSDTEHP